METNKLFALTLPVVALGIWMAKRNPIPPPPPPPPQDRWTAPSYGNYSFPDTSYLQGYSPFYWSYANDVTALIRNEERASLKEVIRPEQVSYLVNYDKPIEEFIIDTFDQVIPVPYVTEPYEFFKYPYETLSQGGDCEDTSILMASILLNRSVEVYCVAGAFVGTQYFGHSWIVVIIPGKGHFLFETTLDSEPAILWCEVHNDTISQHYVPYFYWNKNDIFYNSYILSLLTDPKISKLPKNLLTENKKKKEIDDLWKRR